MASAETDIVIRPGTAADIPAVHALIMELALFEREPEAVKTTPAELLADGFGTRPYYEVFVAEDPQQGIVGMTLFYTAYSTWKGKIIYLDDLIVTESYRGKGLGRRLLDNLITEARTRGVRQMRWQVLDWNEPAIALYRRIGAELDPTWITCKLGL
ncbi:MAG: GNAT family N-acetyltransferase [Bacteroidia bacterium]|nr:GNAT family N-acetyltransferase [Bacteroidia bacterium]